MLMNNLDLDVVEWFDDFVVYGGMGWVVCFWDVFDVIVSELRVFVDDEMLFV